MRTLIKVDDTFRAYELKVFAWCKNNNQQINTYKNQVTTPSTDNKTSKETNTSLDEDDSR